MSSVDRNLNPRLVKLVENIGITDAKELIERALPIILERKAAMNGFLSAGDLEGASTCAHKTLGSIRLYGSAELEGLLKQVKTLNVDQSDLVRFQSQLSDAFSQVIHSCNSFVSK